MLAASLLVSLSALNAFAVLATPTPAPLSFPSHEAREVNTASTSRICGQWDAVVANSRYTLFNDQWNISDATNGGSQCASFTSLSDETVAWLTTWEWSGGYRVKSFADVQLTFGLGVQLGAISSIPTTWNWSYKLSTGAVADVTYDFFTADSPDGPNVHEVMIWLANYNTGPISATYSATGQAVPIVSNLNLAGHKWDLYFGSNGANEVHSFLPKSGKLNNFTADINVFFNFLTSNEKLSTGQYLRTAQAGTEATSGTGTLVTKKFSLSIQ